MLAANMNSNRQTAESLAQAPTMSIEELMSYASERGEKVFVVVNVYYRTSSMNLYQNFQFVYI